MSLDYLSDKTSLFLGRISAFSCAFFILFLGVFFISSWADEAIRISLRISVPSPYDSVSRFIGQIMACLILLIPNLYCGVAFGRFLLRAMPPPPSGRLRLGAILMTIPSAIVCALSSFSYLFFSTFYISSRQAGVSPLTVAIIAMPLLTWWSGVIAPLYGRRLKPHEFLYHPFVLFLRRFSGFSDRGVINLILRQTPLEKPVVFLTPTHGRAGDWNPFLVGFAGLKFLHPFRSIPIIMASPDNEWEQEAEFLIHQAQIIIFDISKRSSAIATEFEMISKAACWTKTIFLKDDTATADYELEQNIRSRGAQIIYYHKSWIRGLPRMILGFWLLASTPILNQLFLLVSERTDNHKVIILCLLFGLLAWLWLYYSFFVRPSIDSAAKISLRNILNANNKTITP